MKRQQRRSADYYSLYNDVTEPMLPPITTMMPPLAFPHESWLQRVFHGLGTFLSFIINKVNQLLALALATLLLLLFSRFILIFFNFSSNAGPFSFSYWVFYLSTPLVIPFQNIPPLPYDKGFIIDVSTLVAILVYAVGITLVRQFLKILVAR
jgi:uncharacterized protein YggT (Ycf19 family)